MSEPRKKRAKLTSWPSELLQDPQIKALDPDGKWILCKTCDDLYTETKAGRKPNCLEGFKITMNAPYRVAAWLTHKQRAKSHIPVNERKKNIRRYQVRRRTKAIVRPLTERCSGIFTTQFYENNNHLLKMFAKYHRDELEIFFEFDEETDRITVHSMDCDGQALQRQRVEQPKGCEKCYALWSEKQLYLKPAVRRMQRYLDVEAILKSSIQQLTPQERAKVRSIKNISTNKLNKDGLKLRKAVDAFIDFLEWVEQNGAFGVKDEEDSVTEL